VLQLSPLSAHRPLPPTEKILTPGAHCIATKPTRRCGAWYFTLRSALAVDGVLLSAIVDNSCIHSGTAFNPILALRSSCSKQLVR
jgi:hypothetical protein